MDPADRVIRFSVIVPVFDRPDEIRELLESLVPQEHFIYEVIIIDDGSEVRCEEVVTAYRDQLPVIYFFKENSGQGFSRNYGFEKASGDYFIVFDSDCLIPEGYFETVQEHLNRNWLDAFGGPDRARIDFAPIQKAISFSMTSMITTGGIRGRKTHSGRFHPRSFNMGISRNVFEKTGGYRITRMGEDIEFSVRIINEGFKVGLIEEAFVYHKRRTDFLSFFRQLRFFGRARINVSRFHPSELRLIHLFPGLFLLFQLAWVVSSFAFTKAFQFGLACNVVFAGSLFVGSFIRFRNLWVSILSIMAGYTQLLAYGSGVLTEWLKKMVKN